DHRAQRRHRTTCLAAGDAYDRLLLFGARALVGNDAYGPVAFGHLFGRAADDREVQPVQLYAVIVAPVDVLNERERAPALRRARTQVAGRTRTEIVTTARLEVFASDLPGHSRLLATLFTCPHVSGAAGWQHRCARLSSPPAAPGRRRRSRRSTHRAADASPRTLPQRSATPSSAPSRRRQQGPPSSPSSNRHSTGRARPPGSAIRGTQPASAPAGMRADCGRRAGRRV